MARDLLVAALILARAGSVLGESSSLDWTPVDGARADRAGLHRAPAPAAKGGARRRRPGADRSRTACSLEANTAGDAGRRRSRRRAHSPRPSAATRTVSARVRSYGSCSARGRRVKRDGPRCARRWRRSGSRSRITLTWRNSNGGRLCIATSQRINGRSLKCASRQATRRTPQTRFATALAGLRGTDVYRSASATVGRLERRARGDRHVMARRTPNVPGAYEVVIAADRAGRRTRWWAPTSGRRALESPRATIR